MNPILNFGASSFAFQRDSPALANELITDCAVAPFTNPEADISTLVDFQALWDTGATNSAITADVIRRCGLIPTGKVRVHGVNGITVENTYLINILLHNTVLFRSLLVSQGTFNGADVLIGMDIINQGDFAITNKDAKTLFTYRFPSQGGVCFIDKDQ